MIAKPMSCLVLLPGLLLSLTGCSKTLTATRAVKLTQSYVDGQNGGIVNTYAVDLTTRLDTYLFEQQHQPGLRRLIAKGWIEERGIQAHYPNFSGRFSGTLSNGVFAVGGLDYTLQLQTNGSTKPPRVQGSYTECFGKTCDTGSVEGIVQEHGSSTLTLRERGLPYVSSFAASLVRGQPDVIVGTLNKQIGPPQPLRLVGQTTGADIQQETFLYVRSGSFPKDILDGVSLKLGHLVVDTCTGLLLDSETRAGAKCSTHVQLSSTAEVFFGRADTKATAEVTFGRQPDGSWVATGGNYTAPQYSLAH